MKVRVATDTYPAYKGRTGTVLEERPSEFIVVLDVPDPDGIDTFGFPRADVEILPQPAKIGRKGGAKRTSAALKKLRAKPLSRKVTKDFLPLTKSQLKRLEVQFADRPDLLKKAIKRGRT